MKACSFLAGFCLLSIGTARAQQPALPTDSIQVERVLYATPPPAVLTAADSTREQLRKENARRLRQTGKNNPAHGPNLVPRSVVTVPRDGLTTPAAAPSPSVLAKDARRREAAAREAAENEKKRAKTLYKRAKKSS